CQEVCPYNGGLDRERRFAGAGLPVPAGGTRVIDLPRLATIGNNQHRQFVKDTALNRIPRRALRRNAILAIGNGEGPADPDERAAIDALLDSEDPQLAALAWRADRRRR
ncbi:MAG: hypothetical protein KC431_19375, partial [Myxococcales bacterium]|nr:hypothetical protein [Myxococcales bacterium]